MEEKAMGITMCFPDLLLKSEHWFLAAIYKVLIAMFLKSSCIFFWNYPLFKISICFYYQNQCWQSNASQQQQWAQVVFWLWWFSKLWRHQCFLTCFLYFKPFIPFQTLNLDPRYLYKTPMWMITHLFILIKIYQHLWNKKDTSEYRSQNYQNLTPEYGFSFVTKSCI